MPNSKNFILTPLYEMKKIIVLKIYLGTLAWKSGGHKF
jgi:hypothetical protein